LVFQGEFKLKLDFNKTEWQIFIDNCEFTDNELEVIPFLRRGWALVDIAAELCISDSTLKRRKRKIENKITRLISTGSL
jgi:DNA-binding NarL/FixJ family response regulator